ncbi:MAG: ribosome maturation factor RimP [Acidimicrobiales bacterium]
MSEDLHGVLSPLLGAAGLELVDLELRPGLVRVTVDRSGGVDLDALADANRILSRALDDLDPLPGRYTLEVSSPGVERRLRTPEQFDRAVGEVVSVRTLPATGDVRRVQGRLLSVAAGRLSIEPADAPGTTVEVPLDGIERARTVFEWGSAAAPSPSRARGKKGPGRGGGPVKDVPPPTERVATP